MERFPFVRIHQSWFALKSTFRFCFLLSRSPCFIVPSLCVPGSGWDGERGWGGVAVLEEGREVWDFPSDLCSQRGARGKMMHTLMIAEARRSHLHFLAAIFAATLSPRDLNYIAFSFMSEFKLVCCMFRNLFCRLELTKIICCQATLTQQLFI